MRHTWEKQPDEDQISGWMKIWVCKVCGCKKILGNYKFAQPHYQRSNQMFDNYIECIDEKAEKLKTID